MARGHNLLTARFVDTAARPGRYADGGGLYLMVRKRGEVAERLWMFRYKRGARGQEREATLSLGPARDVSLATARLLARRCREALEAGRDPKSVIRNAGQAPTFAEMADDLIADVEKGFRNEKHRAQWRMTLGDTYCRSIRSKAVDQISTEDILEVLKPIWHTKPETAARIRGRIERVLDSAKARGYRSGENPARWRGHLSVLLGRQIRLVRGHHRALPWAEIPAFMIRLRKLNSVSALALEWTILTAARTAETIGASRAEIDRDARVWKVPAHRMKGGREHRVPLCNRCLEILDEMEPFGSDWLFPARNPRNHMSLSAMAECLKGLEVDATVHGFRSTFRDWVEESTRFDGKLAEAALAHLVGDEVERAYKRGDALERRRELMDAWANYCGGISSANVVPLVHVSHRPRSA
jgi:integrase